MLSFGQPLALWAFAAVALPILAHMAYRQVTKRYPFPSLRFIKTARIPRTGRKTPTDWPLLLLRALLFAALVCLMADPYWEEPPVAGQGGEGRETILALDLSPSMAGWGGLAEAKEKAEALLGELEGAVGYVGFASEVLGEVAPSPERSAVRAAISNASTDFGRGNPQAGIDRVAKLFSPEAVERRLIILSDLQRSDWQSVYRRLDQEGVLVELMPVGHSRKVGLKREGNLTLSEAKAAPAGPGKIRAWAVIRNSSNAPVETTLAIEAGGEVRERKTVSVPANGATQSQFILPEGDFASAVLSLTEEDEFAADNSRDLWLKAPPPRRFGFWSSTNEDTATAEEIEFLKVAIESAGDNGWNRWLTVQENADGLRIGDLSSELDLLIVSGIGSWFEEEELSPSTKSFLEKGGSVLVTPSEPFSSSISTLRNTGVLDLDFVRVVGGAGAAREPFRISALEPGTHLAKTFSGKAARDLYLTGIYRFGRVRAEEKDGVSIPLRTKEGNPLAVVRGTAGEGKLIFFPFRLNVGWTDLPMRNSFLPLIMELVSGPKGDQDRSWPRLQPGETLMFNDETFRARKPGVFRFQENLVEVELPASESVPEVYESAEAGESLGVGFEIESSSLTAETSTGEESKSLWLWFAIAATLLFICENLWSRPRLTGGEEQQSANA